MALLVGCDPDEGTAGEDGRDLDATSAGSLADEQGVVYLFARSPTSIQPPLVVTPDDIAVVDQVFEPLTRVDAALELRPGAAVSWDVSEDATVHTFTLRRDAAFHDGSAVNAAAFVRAWQRVADRTVPEPSPSHQLLDLVVGIDDARDGGELAGVVAVDDRTLEVTLREPYADLPALVSHPALAPLPPSVDRVSDFDRMPIGNGPLRMAEPWHPGQVIRLEPNPEHPRAPSGVRQVVFRLYDGDDAEQTAYDDLLSGRLDLAPVPEGRMEDARATFGSSLEGRIGPGVIDGPRLATVFLGFNVEMEPYDDPNLRRAIASVVDRGTIDPDLDGSWLPATSVVPAGTMGGYRPADCTYCEHDPMLAEELLWGPEETDPEIEDEDGESSDDPDASGEDAPPVTYDLRLTYPEDDRYEAVATGLAQALEQLDGDITLELDPRPQGEWLAAVREGEAGMFISGWLAEYPTAGAFLDHLFHPDRIGTDNLTRFEDEDVTDLLDAARATTDPVERATHHRQIEEIVLERMPVVPLHTYRHTKVASVRLAGVVVDPAGRIDLSGIDPAAGG